MNELDFEVRLLSEYKIDELDLLFRACDIARKTFYNKITDQEEYEKLDVWMYRIKDALAIAEQQQETD